MLRNTAVRVSTKYLIYPAMFLKITVLILYKQLKYSQFPAKLLGFENQKWESPSFAARIEKSGKPTQRDNNSQLT